MGNQSSKSGGEGPASPTVHQGNSRKGKESKIPPGRKLQNDAASTIERLDLASNPNSPSSTLSQQNSLDEKKMGNDHSKQRSQDDRDDDVDKTKHRPKSTPVRVPRGSDPKRQRGPDSQFEPSGPPRDPDFIPHSNLGLPPRLPLPIGEELHTPGSPIIDALGSLALHEDDVDGVLPRQSSMISNTTIDDDELGDELQSFPPDGGKTVPTWLYWKGGGDRVYVTGTFTGWSRKFRMNKDAKTGHHSALLQLPPGTHHVKFIIDGEMQLSMDYPTAVDYTNILVNYVEVSADDILVEERVPEGVYPPQVLPTGTEAKDHAPGSIGQAQLPKGELTAEPVYWGREWPPYLVDCEKPEPTNRYHRSTRAIESFPPPPGLPLFLGKSILNGTTPMKDDSSVLNMPNHTVLNHLATSSIKNDVLATSITTRYMRKYVTTVVYKPTEGSD